LFLPLAQAISPVLQDPPPLVNLVLRFFNRYVRRNLPQYALGLVMLLATNYAVVRIPTLIGNALDALGPTGPGAGAAASPSPSS
jgi:hypothetical protein